MPYDDPTLKGFAGYFAAKEPGRRDHAPFFANGGQKKVVAKDGQKTAERLLAIIVKNPNITHAGMLRELGLKSRNAIQKDLTNFKDLGCVRRVGPDKGGPGRSRATGVE